MNGLRYMGKYVKQPRQVDIPYEIELHLLSGNEL